MSNIAALPMYDWPACRAATDHLWQALRERVEGLGIAAPASLTRDTRSLDELWQSPDLLVAQTCGLPYVRALASRVELLATPSYDLPDCAPGMYRSRLVVHPDEHWARVEELAGKKAAINGWNSQSGFVALAAMTPNFCPDRFFGEVTVTGSHLASLQAIADGTTDIAAIDAVSFRLAEQHHPQLTAQCRVLASSPETPGLPLITTKGRAPSQVEQIRQAVLEIFNAPETEAIRRPLGITGAVVFADQDYDPIRKMARRVRRATLALD